MGQPGFLQSRSAEDIHRLIWHLGTLWLGRCPYNEEILGEETEEKGKEEEMKK